jgi:hypothetical protein
LEEQKLNWGWEDIKSSSLPRVAELSPHRMLAGISHSDTKNVAGSNPHCTLDISFQWRPSVWFNDHEKVMGRKDLDVIVSVQMLSFCTNSTLQVWTTARYFCQLIKNSKTNWPTASLQAPIY